MNLMNIPDSEKTGSSSNEVVVLATAILLFAGLCYTVYPILSPFVLMGGLLYLLYPFRRNVLARRLMWLSAILFAMWFFHSILALLAPFIIAFLVAYILNPLVTHLHKKKVPRWASSLIAVLLMIGVVLSLFLFVMPPAIQQFQGILNGVGVIARESSELMKSGRIFDVLAQYGIPVEKSREMITDKLSPRIEDSLADLFSAMLGFVTGISSLVLHVINAIIIPFLVFYILLDFPSIKDAGMLVIPPHSRGRVLEIGTKVNDLMSSYIRGALTVAFIQGTVAALGLWLIGVKYSLVLGIMTGVLNFIPYIGLITSLIVSSMVALFSGDPVFTKVFAVIILYLGQKLLEATVLGPKIIGSQVGLHPVLLILCLLIFGFFLGFIGLLIAVPATALIIAFAREWRAHISSKEVTQVREGS